MSVAELSALGYTVGMAHGSVDVERDALEQARAGGTQEAIKTQAEQITRTTLADITNAGKMPDSPEARAQLASQIATSAVETLAVTSQERIEFHERAVAVAAEMPTVYRVEGFGLASYVQIDDANGDGHDETAREFLAAVKDGHPLRRLIHILLQRDRADVVDALQALLAYGYTLTPQIKDNGTGLQLRIVGGTADQTVSGPAAVKTAAGALPDLTAA